VRVFLDIGAHEGMTVEAVLTMDFDHIYAFEPMPAQFAELERRFRGNPKVTLLNFGLSDRTGCRDVYGTNENLEASVFSAGATVDGGTVMDCEFVSASDWFRENLTDEDKVWAKINCEGSETDILDDLVESGEIWKIHATTICFDAENIPGQEQRAMDTRHNLDAIGFHIPRWQLFAVAEGPTHRDRLADWLRTCP
jgi:FkbM family methyltransferase